MKLLKIAALLTLIILLIGCSDMNNPLSSETGEEETTNNHEILYSGLHNNG